MLPGNLGLRSGFDPPDLDPVFLFPTNSLPFLFPFVVLPVPTVDVMMFNWYGTLL